MPSDARSPRLNPDTDLKMRHLHQHLHRLGQIPAAPHPFVKQVAESNGRIRRQNQAAERGDRLSRQPQRPPSLAQHLAHWRNRLVQRTGNAIDHAIEQQWTVPLPQRCDTDFEADNQAAIAPTRHHR